MMEELLFFFVSFLASIAGSLSGIGGGILIKPLLESVTGYRPDIINFLSGCAVLSMAAVSLVASRGSDTTFEYRRGTMMAIGSVVGGLGGRLIFQSFDALFSGTGVRAVQSILLGFIAIGLLVYRLVLKPGPARDLQRNPACMAAGLALGLLSAFLGIGGGPLNLVVLVSLFAMDNKAAALHSIYIILYSQAASLLLTVLQGAIPTFPAGLLPCVIGGGASGALVGRQFGRHLHNRHIGFLYDAILAVVALLSMYNLARL